MQMLTSPQNTVSLLFLRSYWDNKEEVEILFLMFISLLSSLPRSVRCVQCLTNYNPSRITTYNGRQLEEEVEEIGNCFNLKDNFVIK